jgi:hypothetical protein
MQKHVVTVHIDVYAEDAEAAAELVNIGLKGSGFTQWQLGEYPQVFTSADRLFPSGGDLENILNPGRRRDG